MATTIRLLTNPPNFKGDVLERDSSGKPSNRFTGYWQRWFSFTTESLQALATGLGLQIGGSAIGNEPNLNLIAGTGVTLTAVDDADNERVSVTIDAAASDYDLVQDPDFWFLE